MHWAMSTLLNVTIDTALVSTKYLTKNLKAEVQLQLKHVPYTCILFKIIIYN